MKKLFVANFKMRPTSPKDAVALAKIGNRAGVVFVPPSLFLSEMRRVAKKAEFGVQNVWTENPKKGGAFTGEISVAMAKASGAKYVIVGHSERRALFNETDSVVAVKSNLVADAALTPIVCVGEQREVRMKGLESAKAFVRSQLEAALLGYRGKKLIVAYEPVWAIGTGENDQPESAAEMAQFIKAWAKDALHKNVPVLYGGSVNSKNIGAFAREKHIDGFLVGGASADPKELQTMVKVVLS